MYTTVKPSSYMGPRGHQDQSKASDAVNDEEEVSSNFILSGYPEQRIYGLLRQEDLIQMLPMVNEATTMAEKLNKGVKFEVTLVSPQARGLKNGKAKSCLHMGNVQGDGQGAWLWDWNKFINRKFLMQEMYQNYVEGDADWDVSQEKDPFWEPADTEKLIGTCHVLLQSLSYNIDLTENLNIADYKGGDQGHLQVSIIPCTSKWEDVGEDDFIEDPKEMLGKPVYCKLQINAARGLPGNIDKSFCKYKFYLDDKYTQTSEVGGTINPDFNHEKKITIKSATEQFVNYLEAESLYIEVWGRQKGKSTVQTKPPPKFSEKTKKDTKPMEPVKNGQPPAPLPPIQDNKIKDEVNMYKKQAADKEQKPTSMNDYIKKRKAMGHSAMRMEDVEALLAGRNPPGRPVETGCQSGSGGSGGAQESKACTIQ